MLSESSGDEVPNVLMRLCLDSDEGDGTMSCRIEELDVSSDSSPNVQTTGSIVCSRPKRVRTFVCDEEQASSSQGRSGEGSSSNDNRLPGNSASSLYLEARPQGNVALNINIPAHRPSTTTYNWQGSKATMHERFAFLFNNEILSDVSFLVGRGTQQQRIPAHKLVLSSGSAVFDAMFNGTLATASAEIEVPDVEPAAFLAVLLFLYTDEILIDPETVMTTLYTAKKYAVSPLEKHCVDFLRSNLTSDNAFLLLTQARLFDEPQLAAVCLDTIDKFTTDALNADGFTDIDIDTLMVVLERDTLRVRELRLFQAVIRWSEAECARQQLSVTPENQRLVVGKALSLIRFPLMSVEEFAGGPGQSGLLTDREVVSLFLYFTSSIKSPIGFKAVPRWRMTSKEQIVCKFHQQIDKRSGYSGTNNCVRFNIDKRMFLIGYGVYGGIHGPAEYKVLMELIHTTSGKVIASNDISFNCNGSSYIYRLMFKEPAEILPNTVYTASATFKGPDSLYGSKGLRKMAVECGSANEKIKFHINYATGCNTDKPVETGQIPELIFYA